MLGSGVRVWMSVLLLACTLPVLAQQPAASAANVIVPPLVNFSGVLTGVNGTPLTGVVGVTFYLYKDSESGTPLWMETQNVRADKNGHYAVMLGSASSRGVPTDLFISGEARWLGVQAQGQNEQPRVLLLSVPYALKAGDAETLGGMPASAFVQAASNTAHGAAAANAGAKASATSGSRPIPAAAVTGSGTTNFIPIWTSSTNLANSAFFQTLGQVGLGTTAPGAKLDVKGSGSISIRGTTSNTAGNGLLGNATATSGVNFGVQGFSSSPSGVGVQGTSPNNGVVGIATATTGHNFGVVGQTASTTAGAAGVNGFASATTGVIYGVAGGTASRMTGAAGVSGMAFATTGAVAGVIGQTASTTTGATGVNGIASGKTGATCGVCGTTASTTNFAAGVNGFASGATGVTFGVIGGSASTSGIAVQGNATATSGVNFGVKGFTASPSGVAGAFFNTSGSGLILQGASGSSFTQVFSVDASGNGFYAGNLNVTGKLTKGSGSFKIDHPLDPANKYLSHSFVESPDMMNMYNGNITTDRRGLARVILPGYFEALNRDFPIS